MSSSSSEALEEALGVLERGEKERDLLGAGSSSSEVVSRFGAIEESGEVRVDGS